MPPDIIMKDRILLREWEQEQMNDYYKNIYDRRNIDLDVFKQFQAQGEIIKTTVIASELTKDKKFWQTEQQIMELAAREINKLKRIKPYDVHKLQPQTYDLKMLGDPQSGRPSKKKNQAADKKKKEKVEKKQQKKTAAKLGNDGKGLLDEIEEDDRDDKDSDIGSDDVPDDKYDPLAR